MEILTFESSNDGRQRSSSLRDWFLEILEGYYFMGFVLMLNILCQICMHKYTKSQGMQFKWYSVPKKKVAQVAFKFSTIMGELWG